MSTVDFSTTSEKLTATTLDFESTALTLSYGLNFVTNLTQQHFIYGSPQIRPMSQLKEN
jgi:hypothetical protein